MTTSDLHDLTPEAHRLEQIRRRLWRAQMIPFAILMAVAAAIGFWPGDGPDRPSWLGLLMLLGLIVPIPMAVLVRRALGEIQALDEDRARLSDLYGRARLDALQDVLTGLGNHRAFQEEMARQLEAAKRDRTSLAMLLIDVDDLKAANDDRGHAGGDELLAAVGQICSSALRRNDRAFRIGGDEFALLLPGADVARALTVGRRILSTALEGGNPAAPVPPFSVSIGVSAYPAPSTASHLLYQHADAALYWCKRHGRTSVAGYDPGRHGRAAGEQSIAELGEAVSTVLQSRLLRAVYQPIFSLETGAPIGFEGLVRPTAEAPFADASALFSGAEVAGRTVELDLACIDTVAASAGPLEPGTYLSVNVSPRTLESEEFHAGELVSIFRRRSIPVEQVVLELTEREAVQDLAHLRRNVAECRRAGMRLAADDVGAGNAGLRLLSEIKFDIMKIDLSLVQGGVLNEPSHAVLTALRDIAAGWKASIVAEGIETAEQLRVVRELGMAAGQGYLLGRPGPNRAVQPVGLDEILGASQQPDVLAEAFRRRRAAVAATGTRTTGGSIA